ncbi:MAG: hypothetical protein IJN27_04410, partial [Oscillospiraceae bacterium]|nr:hypothetical protein [Oscillospiraceae bacterium]
IHIRDIRIFTNSINKAVGLMKSAGFAAKVEQNITDTVAEYKIVIPLENPKGQNKAASVQTAI